MGDVKILITGGKGQLGLELTKILKNKKCELGALPKFYEDVKVLSLGSLELDITKMEEVLKVLEKEKPYALINCAAYTNVDECEDFKEVAFRVNSLGPRNLDIAYGKFGVNLVHISTDYVFSGEEYDARLETDQTNPKSFYGKTKALGEEYVKSFCSRWFILRTSWLYGEFGNNFVKTIVKLAKETKTLKVVEDQFGTPTNVEDLCFVILNVLTTKEFGVYHASGQWRCSWFNFACEIVSNFKIDAEILPCNTEEFKRKAKRPKFSELENLMLKTIGKIILETEKEAVANFARKNINSG